MKKKIKRKKNNKVNVIKMIILRTKTIIKIKIKLKFKIIRKK